MTKQTPMEKMRDLLTNMPPDHKAKLIKNYQDFSRLKSMCEARKEIEILPKMAGIKVLKNTADVKELAKIVKFLNPGSFKWIKKGKEV